MRNINRTPPPPRPPSRWPLYVFIGILAVLLLGGLALAGARRQSQQAAAQPTATSRAVVVVAPTATTTNGAPAAGPTATPISGGATSPPGATPTSAATPLPPTNPTSMHVVSGSCTVHHIAWTWSGAQRATSYEAVLYNPVSGAQVKNITASNASYTLGAGPGATVTLKVRSHNATGAAPTYFTPPSTGRVPLQISNPRSVTATTTGHTINWAWTAVPHAAAYDLVLYHYQGGTPQNDVTARRVLAHWSVPVTPGVPYHLKVRSVGDCAPRSYYTPSTTARVGAPPTPAGH